MTSQFVTRIQEVRDTLAAVRRQGLAVGFVPTMGALHEGHGALMERARKECQYVVVSIFVNPLQFERRDDFEAYKLDLAADIDFCSARGVDLIFAPSPDEMYRPGQSTSVEVAGLSETLCGIFRPGHFRGVATVVTKLFQIVPADRAYFGEKDAQQLAIIQRLVTDLDIPVTIVPVPTVREPDGLAMSSRNRRLSAEHRRIAPALYAALQLGQQKIAAGCRSTAEVQTAMRDALAQHPEFRVEYLEVVDPQTMALVQHITASVRIAAAAWLGGTRLIDNVYCAAESAA